MPQDLVTLYHAAPSRSSATLYLLEELGAPYRVHLVDFKKSANLAPAYLAINPLGKVPAIEHRGQIVTETVAIMVYLSDAFPANGLAPAIGDPMRGPYLRWMAMYAAAWEPAIVDRAMKRDPGQRAMSPYGSFEAVFGALTAQLGRHAFLLGDRFTTADALWGRALDWMTKFELIPDHPAIGPYRERLRARPALAAAEAKDRDLMGGQSR